MSNNTDWAAVINNQAQVFNKIKEDTLLYEQTLKKAYAYVTCLYP